MLKSGSDLNDFNSKLQITNEMFQPTSDIGRLDFCGMKVFLFLAFDE